MTHEQCKEIAWVELLKEEKRFVNIVGEKTFEMILKFKPVKSRYILEYEEQKADKTELIDDGSLIFYKKTALSNGHQVEVLEPEELRQTITQNREDVSIYKNSV